MIYERTSRDEAVDVAFCYGGWDRDLPPGIQYGPVIRDIYIVECCTAGKGGVIINGQHFPVQGGDCYLLCPGDIIIHQADWKEPRQGAWCGIYGLQVESAFRKAGITAQAPFAPASAFPAIFRECAALADEQNDPDGGALFRQRGHIYALLGELLRHTPSMLRGDSSIEKALQMMETCYHEEMSVEKMARAAGLERSYFSTLFRRATGQAPHQYLSALRIRKACALLSGGDYSIATVASAVGIPPENFARLFARQTGMTPGQYRQKNRF